MVLSRRLDPRLTDARKTPLGEGPDPPRQGSFLTHHRPIAGDGPHASDRSPSVAEERHLPTPVPAKGGDTASSKSAAQTGDAVSPEMWVSTLMQNRGEPACSATPLPPTINLADCMSRCGTEGPLTDVSLPIADCQADWQRSGTARDSCRTRATKTIDTKLV